MPTSSTINSSGIPTSNAFINSTAVGAGLNSQNRSNKQKFKARVTAVDPSNGTIVYETNGQKLGRSNVGSPTLTNIARPLDIYNIQIPIVGEYVEIIAAPDALGLSDNKNIANLIAYYSKILNAWDNVNGNKVLDQTVQGQVSSNQMTTVSQNNINKSFILGGV